MESQVFTEYDEALETLKDWWGDQEVVRSGEAVHRFSFLVPFEMLPVNLQDKFLVNPARYIELLRRALIMHFPEPESSMPPNLAYPFQLRVTAPPDMEILPMRSVRAMHVGKMVRMKGIVTRLSDVKPLLLYATYICTECGYENFQEIKSRQFMPQFTCINDECAGKKKQKESLQLLPRRSRFTTFQEVRIQELPDQVPIGHTPRSAALHCMGDLTRLCSAGDIVTITGLFLPTPYTGWQAIRAGLIADTYLEALTIDKQKKSYSQYTLDAISLEKVKELSMESNIYERMSQSIAPEIYGHEDVKKALLLMMVGGATKEMPDGMRIRGDINICLVGDPGVAKSQLLKHIAQIAPRGVYTSGKGATGVGLTAAVVKDPATNEFVLEGGSLVLSDMGICCIDEFDKMDETDRTAIHEVMEQQTISIAKAGINTTLNARTAVLAAANPVYGRYNPRLSPSENINLPAALLSRFDLLFLLLDRPNLQRDLELGMHVTHVHMHGKRPESEFEPLDVELMRTYIAQARNINPYIPEHLSDYIVSAYVNIRQNEVHEPEKHTYTSARTLLGILRLSQALARLSFRDEVNQDDVDEAIRLMDASKASLYEMDRTARGATANKVDPKSQIYQILRELALQSPDSSLPYDSVLPRVITKGFTQAQLDACLDELERFEVLYLSANRSTITFA